MSKNTLLAIAFLITFFYINHSKQATASWKSPGAWTSTPCTTAKWTYRRSRAVSVLRIAPRKYALALISHAPQKQMRTHAHACTSVLKLSWWKLLFSLSSCQRWLYLSTMKPFSKPMEQMLLVSGAYIHCASKQAAAETLKHREEKTKARVS